MKPYFTVKQSEWDKMPPKTRLALEETAKSLLKHYGKKRPTKKGIK